MTEVLRRIARKSLLAWICAVMAGTALGQQEQLPASTNVTIQAQNNQKAAEQLYLQLRSAGLDPARVFQVREASVDRNQLHISLDDGTIAFTQDVNGRVTGAFFEGDGEVLVVPPDQAERASMMLFTGAAILEERFETAYFRFNDDTFSDLQPALRALADGKDFALKWNETAHNLAEWDALRLFVTFSRFLPPAVAEAPATTPLHVADRFLHARVQGVALGAFDAYYDSTANEQIAIAQQKQSEGVHYYNVWTSFPITPAETRRPAEEQQQDEIAIRSYRIRAQVKPPTTLQADASLQVEVLRGGARALLFELSRYLKVSEVKANGQPVELIQNQALEGSQLARRGNDILAVVFPQPVRAGQKMELTFSYAGDVLSEAGGGLLYVGARGIWYPNRGLASADFDLQFQYPGGWTLLATGKRVREEQPTGVFGSTSEPSQTSRWVTERPIPIAGFNLGRYSEAVAHAGTTTIETYAAAGVERSFPTGENQAVVVPTLPSVRPQPPQPVIVTQPPPPPSPARNAQVVADGAARATEFFSQRFGPFPYSTLQLTQMPGQISQGWPGLVFLSSFAFLTPEERSRLHLSKAQEILDRQVTAHETAHQWWGDLVYWRGYRDQWMFEGLANYCSLMLLEAENPADFRVALEKYREDLLRRNKAGAVLKDAGPVTLGVRLSSSEFPDGYEAISYGRGTWLFHMLRHILDDSWAAEKQKQASNQAEVEPFVQALHKIRERYAGKPITTRQLLQVFAEDLPPSEGYEGRKSLDWFYEGWVNGTALPRFNLQGVKMAPKGNSMVVTGTILQKDAPEELVTSVPIYAALAGERRVFLGRIFADGPESSFRLTAPQGLKHLLVDPEQTVLTRSR